MSQLSTGLSKSELAGGAGAGGGQFLLTGDQAARLLGLSRRTLERQRVQGGGPQFLKLGRTVRYSPDDIAAWLAARRFGSTGEADAAKVGAT